MPGCIGVMDAETLHLLLRQVAGLWVRPLDEYELAVWKRFLAPETGNPVDPEFAAEALLLARHSGAFEHKRPDPSEFASFYDRVVRASEPPAPDPAEKPATSETVSTVLEEARAVLHQAAEVGEQLDRARSKLTRAVTEAENSQERLL